MPSGRQTWKTQTSWHLLKIDDTLLDPFSSLSFKQIDSLLVILIPWWWLYFVNFSAAPFRYHGKIFHTTSGIWPMSHCILVPRISTYNFNRSEQMQNYYGHLIHFVSFRMLGFLTLKQQQKKTWEILRKYKNTWNMFYWSFYSFRFFFCLLGFMTLKKLDSFAARRTDSLLLSAHIFRKLFDKYNFCSVMLCSAVLKK